MSKMMEGTLIPSTAGEGQYHENLKQIPGPERQASLPVGWTGDVRGGHRTLCTSVKAWGYGLSTVLFLLPSP